MGQLWYDDPETLRLKYAAIKQAGVRAVGMWTAE
jgi:spore germination protein YaaH